MDIQINNQTNNKNIIGTLNLIDKQINVYGDIAEPLIKCQDLLIHVLGYRDCTTAKWFRTMKTNQRYVIQEDTQPPNLAGQQTLYFTECGIYKALMKSTKPIAEQFQMMVEDMLKRNRINNLQQIKDLQIQYNSTLKYGCIYGFFNKRYQCYDYIGQTSNRDPKNRITQHKQQMQKLEIPFYRGVIMQKINQDYEVITIKEVEFTDEKTILNEEYQQQQLYKSTYNQPCLICRKCGKEYTNKSVQCFEQHRDLCYDK